MGKVYVATCAYNAENTIERCIKSVLQQTYTDFYYYVCNNASTDKTGEIVERFARQDPRIVVSCNKVNHDWSQNEEYAFLPHTIADDDYFCLLDADDALAPSFLAEMIEFVNKNDLDFAACGNEFIDGKTGVKGKARLVKENLILDTAEKFSEYFPEYYQFMRTGWAKLYTGRSAHNRILYSQFPSHFPRAYGGDTYIVFQCLRKAKKVGIYAKALYDYYISFASRSYQMHPQRIECDCILMEDALDFLTEKAGGVSLLNREFLDFVYYNAISDTEKVVFHSQLAPKEKIESIFTIYSCEYTKELYGHKHTYVADADALLEKLKCETSRELLALPACRTEDGADMTASILEVLYSGLPSLVDHAGLQFIIMKIPEMLNDLLKAQYEPIVKRLQRWHKRSKMDIPSLSKLEIRANIALNKTDAEIFALLCGIKKERPESARALDMDSQITSLLQKYPLLQGLSGNFALLFRNTLTWIMQENYLRALEAFLSVTGVTIEAEDEESYMTLGQNLAAAAENIPTYIYFKKVWISFLLDAERKAEAKQELDELEPLLRDDEELAALRKRIAQ